jgi:anti-anti-sigma factor
VTGRLDNHWSSPLEEAFADMIREGVHNVRLDLSRVTYISSAGLGVLMMAYRDLDALQGTLVITAASERVRTVLQLADLDTLLFALPGAAPAARAPAEELRQIKSENAVFDVHKMDAPPSECRLVGKPEKIAQEAYASADASSIHASETIFALGVGALGHAFDECRNLFGEFVAVAGSAAYMPTDGTSTPDYVSRSADLVPEIQALYAMVFRGRPACLLRFEGSTTTGAVPLSEIVSVSGSVAGTPHFGIVIAAEVSGLVCTMLRRSPVENDAGRFDFPAVRGWLSFAGQREYARSSSFVVGVASSAPTKPMAPFVRPVSDQFSGHFHAAITAFRSLSRGPIEMGDVLKQAFQPRSVLSVVHLLRDNRPIEGAGESEFHRGACWVFPIDQMAVAK